MKYELVQIINSIKDSLAELDDLGQSHPLITGIYNSVCKMEEIIEDDEDDVERAFRSEDYD